MIKREKEYTHIENAFLLFATKGFETPDNIINKDVKTSRTRSIYCISHRETVFSFRFTGYFRKYWAIRKLWLLKIEFLKSIICYCAKIRSRRRIIVIFFKTKKIKYMIWHHIHFTWFTSYFPSLLIIGCLKPLSKLVNFII